jgi:uncharacterized protein YndB with AHSA1/START domain
MDFNWSTFTKRVNINAPIAAIYAMRATKAGMESWFLRNCAYAKPDGQLVAGSTLVEEGDGFVWHWHGWPDDVSEKGTIISANGTDGLSFTFGQAGAENMVCKISIYPENGETICELVQTNIPVDERGKHHFHIGCNTGWTFYMANLKSILEGGIDLRNKNVDLKNVLNS